MKKRKVQNSPNWYPPDRYTNNLVKNTRGKHVKQNQVAFFTWYPSDIHVNGYTINPCKTTHVEYTCKCTPIIHMRHATCIKRKKIRYKLHLISTCKSTPIIHMKKSTWFTSGFLVEHVSTKFPFQLHVDFTWCGCWVGICSIQILILVRFTLSSGA